MSMQGVAVGGGARRTESSTAITQAPAAGSDSRLVQVAKTIALVVAALFSAVLVGVAFIAELSSAFQLFEGELFAGSLVLFKGCIDAIGDVWDANRPTAQNQGQNGALQHEVQQIK